MWVTVLSEKLPLKEGMLQQRRGMHRHLEKVSRLSHILYMQGMELGVIVKFVRLKILPGLACIRYVFAFAKNAFCY